MRDVLIDGAATAAMRWASSKFLEDAPSWPRRTTQSLNINIVGAGSAATAFLASQTAEVQLPSVESHVSIVNFCMESCGGRYPSTWSGMPRMTTEVLFSTSPRTVAVRERMREYPPCKSNDVKRSMRRWKMTLLP
jgi:hypothetical protein